MLGLNEVIEKTNRFSKIDFKKIELDLSPSDTEYFKAMSI